VSDTVRNWHRAFEGGGIEALKTFDHEGSSSHLTEEQEIALADWIDPRLSPQHSESRGLCEADLWGELQPRRYSAPDWVVGGAFSSVGSVAFAGGLIEGAKPDQIFLDKLAVVVHCLF
jgi:hypothetical protein